MINYHARWVIPVTRPPFADGTVSVSGTRIVYVGPRRDAPAGEDAELGDAVLLPGLVNAHTHLELTAMRGLLTGLDFVSWIRALTAAVDAGCLAAARSRLPRVAGTRSPRTLAANVVPSGRCSVMVSASRGPGSGSAIRYQPSTA